MKRNLIWLCLLACSHSSDSGEDPSGKADSFEKLSYDKVSTKAMFDSLSLAQGVLTKGRSLKFLIDQRDAKKPHVYFMNSNYQESGKTPEKAKFHFYFAGAVLSDFSEDIPSFNDATYWTQDKKYVAGTIQTYQLEGDKEPTYGIQFYPQDVAKEKTIVTALKNIQSVFTIPKAKLAFVATGPQQTTKTVDKDIKDLKMANLTIDQILGSIQFIPMNLGECWGYLRIFPANNDDLTPLDIPVFDELPLDLAVVAGVITKDFQDTNSHVNLKSKERNTPNMVLRDASPTHADLKSFADKPVHLVIKGDSYKIESSTEAVVKAKYEERTKKPWVAVSYTKESQLIPYRQMCSSDASDCITYAKAFGSKAANLGFLNNKNVLGRVEDSESASKKIGYDLVPNGFGIPIQHYHDFVAYTPNKSLRDKLNKLVSDEKAGILSPAQRIMQLKAVQQEFYVAQFPPGMPEAIEAMLGKVLPGVEKIKVRSSANAEDLPNFDGAGLHDSFSANLTKEDNDDGSCMILESEDDVDTKLEMKPKTLRCGIKGVYASLWNRRAIEERSFARLDHATVGMGISIVPKYDLESDIAANSVIVTRVVGVDDLYGYSLSNQKGNNLVTNPTPKTLSETVIAAFAEESIPPTFIVTRYAQPEPNGPRLTSTVYTEAQMKTMLDLTKQVERAYCDARDDYYGGDCRSVTADPDKPKALDLEIKFLQNGEFIFKQVREFGGR